MESVGYQRIANFNGYYGISLREGEFHLVGRDWKPGKGYAEATLEAILQIVEGNLDYVRCNDALSMMEQPERMRLLGDIADKICARYNEKVKNLCWIRRFFGRVFGKLSSKQKRVNALYRRIPQQIKKRINWLCGRERRQKGEGAVLPLPNEMTQMILRQLPLTDIFSFAQTNFHGHVHAEDAIIFRAREYGYDGWKLTGAEKFLLGAFRFINQNMVPISKESDRLIDYLSYETAFANLSKRPRNQIFALFEASSFKSSPEFVQYLRKIRTDTTIVPGEGYQALRKRIEKGDFEGFKLLCELGADYHSTNQNGSNLYISVAATNLKWTIKKKFVDYLFSLGVDIEHENRWNHTPMMWAYFHGKRNSIILLLELGAKPLPIHRRIHDDLWSLRPTRYTTRENAPSIFRILFAMGANPEFMDHTRHLTDALIATFADGEGRTNLNLTDGNGETPLMWACGRNAVKIATRLIERGADVNLPTSNGWTPLHFAASHGSAEVVQLLLDKGADIDARNEKGETPLDLTKDPKVRELLLLANIRKNPNRAHVFALFESDRFMSSPEFVQYVRKIHTDTTIVSGEGYQALRTRIRMGDFKGFKLLCELGADYHATRDNGNNLYVSVLYFNLDWTIKKKFLDYLFSLGVNIEQENRWNETPLMWAYFDGKKHSIIYLLELGAKPLPIHRRIHKDLWDFQPTRYTTRGSSLSFFRILFAMGANPEFMDHTRHLTGELIATFADEEGRTNLNLHDGCGETPLMWACAGSAVKIATRLIELGADVNLPGTYHKRMGWTPLHYAAHYGSADVVQLLLDKGADMDVRNERGEIPLDLAKNSRVRKLLLDAVR